MTKNQGMPQGVKAVMYWMLGLGIIALIGLVMIILFGNLSGNTGFGAESTFKTEEGLGFINDSGYNLTGASDAGFASVSITGAFGNTTDGAVNNSLILAANYTVDTTTGTVTNITDETWIGVLFNYTYLKTSQSELDAENVILNYTLSVTNTSAQFPVVGTILGIAILLVILIGLLIFAISRLMKVADAGSGGSGSRTSETPLMG